MLTETSSDGFTVAITEDDAQSLPRTPTHDMFLLGQANPNKSRACDLG